MNKQVIIMRGPAGSGKGSWLSVNARDACVVSADRYFMKRLGEPPEDDCRNPVIFDDGHYYEYVFNPAEIALAHAYCLNEVLKALVRGEPLVAVDNTNTHLWEFVNYIDVASLAGYDVRVVSLKVMTVAEIVLCAYRNVHGVPIEVVAKMAYEYEGWPDEEYVQVRASE